MSSSFHLVCHETEQHLWVGQGPRGNMTTFYYGVPETMAILGEFLRRTIGKPLVLMSGEQVSELEGYEDLGCYEDDEKPPKEHFTRQLNELRLHVAQLTEQVKKQGERLDWLEQEVDAAGEGG